MTCQNNISTIFLSLSLSPSYILSLHIQIGCLSPRSPRLTPSRQSSPKKTSFISKGDDVNYDSLKVGKHEARLTNSPPPSTSRRFPSSSPSGCSPQKNKEKRKHTSPRISANSGYQQPTVSSRTRALSPYTHRRMCQLSEDAQQRLSHLQLGPHHFRKETETQPPFLVGNITYSSKLKAADKDVI